jgi:hypothetical protein
MNNFESTIVYSRGIEMVENILIVVIPVKVFAQIKINYKDT